MCPTNSTGLAALADASYSAQSDIHSLYSAKASNLGWINFNGKNVLAWGTGAATYYNNGFFGQGIGIALIDTGVANVPGLDNGNVIQGPDLSFDSQAQYASSSNPWLAHNDGYGHGTHLAGLMVGRDSTNPNPLMYGSTLLEKPYSWSDPAAFTGMAPAAHVVSLKVADSQGAVDVTQMIAAIDWVVKHRSDPGMNIRVLNLSYGVNAGDEQKADALSYAVDQAWKAGIVVVAATGNGGLAVTKQYNPGVTSPAYNTDIVSVGTYDPATMLVPAYSSYASRTNSRNPDVVAPGQSLPSLHVLGSQADEDIAGDCAAAIAATGSWTPPVVGAGARFVRATGTSQAAAIASGAIALMLSKNPSMTPDYVKALLRQTAAPLPGSQQAAATGQGSLDLNAAYSKTPTQLQQQVTMTGGSNIESARGMTDTGQPNDLTDGTTTQTPGMPGACTPGNQYYPTYCYTNVVYLTGNFDVLGNPINLTSLQAAEKAGAAWVTNSDGTESWVGDPALMLGAGMAPDAIYGSSWQGHSWAGHSWVGHSWADFDWSGHSWAGHSWADNDFSGHSWAGHSWVGHSWAGHSWASHSWRDLQWS